MSQPRRNEQRFYYGALEAGVMVMAVPCLLLFILLQRHYVRGFMTGALRG
jgi:multiple sugar transport system permease protein